VISKVVLSTPNASTGAVVGTVTATDPNGDKLTYKATTSTKGKVAITTAGVFTYTPTAAARHAAAKSGAATSVTTDTVTVTVTDSKGAATSQAVTVTIAPKNTVPTTKVTVGTPNSSTGVVTGSVAATDVDRDALTYTVTKTPAKGTVAVTATGGFTYTPTAPARHDAAATTATAAEKADTFTVTVADGFGGSVAVPVTVTIRPQNTAPTGAKATVGTPNAATGVVAGTVTAVDAEKDTLTYGASKPANGAVVFKADGSFTYTPTATARTSARSSATAKTDPFTVTISDAHGGTVTVTAAPVISPINSAPVFGSPVIGVANSATGVVTGTVTATDADRDTLTYSTTTATAKGTVAVNASTGAFTYTPNVISRYRAAVAANAADKVDTFSVTATDKFGGSSIVSVVVPVAAANSNVLAVNGSLTYGAVVGKNGSVYQESVGNNGSSTSVTVIRIDGTTATYSKTFTQLGAVGSDITVGPDGTIYQASATGNRGPDFTKYTSTLRVIKPDGTAKEYTQAGTILNSPVIGENGTVYQAVVSGNTNDGAFTTYVIAVKPDGTSMLSSNIGTGPGLFAASDGSVYHITNNENAIFFTIFSPGGITTSSTLVDSGYLWGWTNRWAQVIAEGPNNSVYLQTYGTDANSNGRWSVVRLSGGQARTFLAPEGAVEGGGTVASDGRIYWTTSPNANGTETSVVVVGPTGGTIMTKTWTGTPSGKVVLAPNGDAYQLSTGTGSTVTVLRANGTTSVYTNPGTGRPVNYPEVQADGSVIQIDYDSSKNVTSLLLMRTDGTSSVYTQPGAGGGPGGTLITNGALYATTSNGNLSTLMRRFLADGSVRDVTQPGQPYGGPFVGMDGSAYQTSIEYLGNSSNVYVSVTRPDGTTQTYQQKGAHPAGLLTFGGDGTVYQSLSTGLWIVDKVKV
jgi:VCBS repeat-containing protein